MKFQTEIELVNILKEVIKTLIYKDFDDRIGVFEEVSLGYGIADVVISSLKRPKKELKSSYTILNTFDINIYNLISKEEKLTFEEINNITRCPKFKIGQSLSKLEKDNYIVYNYNKKTFSIEKDYELLFDINFAIEAKLKDWKRALNQAYRYKWFAEYSYVVLDDYYCKPAMANIELFQKFNVGLASINHKGELLRHYKPLKEKPYDINMQMYFSEMIKESYELER